MKVHKIAMEVFTMAQQSFSNKYGPWALVTGAARGMGAEFSRQIAAKGINVVMVDLLADELARTADDIRKTSGREVVTINVDLSQPDFIDSILKRIEGLDIGLLVSNAAYGPVGMFVERSLEEKLRMIAVNVRAPLTLVHEFATRMTASGRGGIIMVSSASAMQGTPYVANYAATKAYNLILAESLWVELREKGVDVLGFMPGTTRTPGYMETKPQMERAKIVKLMEPGPTVAEALNALGRKPSHIAGRGNRLAFFISGKLMPRKLAIKLTAKMMRNLYRNK
jgi:short-subunit dehydrogenase